MCGCHDLSDVVALEPSDILYRRVHHSHKDNLDASCSKDKWKDGLSCDWALLCTPQEAVRELPGYLLEISVKDCLSIGLSVRYCPVVDPACEAYPNYAHCLLIVPPEAKSKLGIARIRTDFLGLAKFRTIEAPQAELPVANLGNDSVAIDAAGATPQPWYIRLWLWLRNRMFHQRPS